MYILKEVKLFTCMYVELYHRTIYILPIPSRVTLCFTFTT